MNPKRPTTTIVITVQPGQALPQPGNDLVTTGMSGIHYITHVTSISKLEWVAPHGDLVVTVRGHKRPMEPGEVAASWCDTRRETRR